MVSGITIQRAVVVLAMTAGLAAAQQPSSTSGTARESLDEAWWTGPMLAPSAATLPRGHLLVEPYLFDVITQGRYDRRGVLRTAPHSHSFGSLTYMLYGLADRLTVGLIPTAGFNIAGKPPGRAGGGWGDLTLQAQYRLRKFREGSWTPGFSFAVQETLPTGKYDRLGSRPTDGMGIGAYTTTLALYSQTYLWLPNGRILRTRFNLSQAFSSDVDVKDASVYGTADGFRGDAKPGNTFLLDCAAEYSLTRRWVLALDVTFRHDGNTSVRGHNMVNHSTASTLTTGSADAFGLAPAIEYNRTSWLGVLLGVRVIPVGRNTPATITPAVAINFVH